MLALVLPMLALTIMAAIAVCGWLIFKPEPLPSQRPRNTRPSTERSPNRIKPIL